MILNLTPGRFWTVCQRVVAARFTGLQCISSAAKSLKKGKIMVFV
jgi:hypothetical protein